MFRFHQISQIFMNAPINSCGPGIKNLMTLISNKKNEYEKREKGTPGDLLQKRIFLLSLFVFTLHSRDINFAHPVQL